MLPNDNVIGEVILILYLKRLGIHILSEIDELSSLLLDLCLDSTLDVFVGFNDFCNDKGNEHQHGESTDYDPKEPVNDVLSLTEFIVFKSGEMEVAEGNSKSD